MELMKASREWATRPADERFTNLDDLYARVADMRNRANASVLSSRKVQIAPHPDDPTYGVMVDMGETQGVLSHWSFGQMAGLAGAGSATSYLRTLPAPIVADCMNWGLKIRREAADVQILVHDYRDELGLPATLIDGGSSPMGNRVDALKVSAATGPNYGRIWNEEVVRSMRNMFGNGVDGDWRVPGTWGKPLDQITKENTTIFGSDRDIFVFLADEQNKIDVPNRRNGHTGAMSRGFFCWNSEVGDGSLGVAYFLFDYVCGNRIVWGAREYKELRIRHTAKAPDRWAEEIEPVLAEYRKGSAKPIEETIKAAQEAKLEKDVEDFLKNRFTRREITLIQDAHMAEENRPMETIWDVTTGVTAYAKSINNNDARVAVERKGGAILDLVAA